MSCSVSGDVRLLEDREVEVVGSVLAQCGVHARLVTKCLVTRRREARVLNHSLSLAAVLPEVDLVASGNDVRPAALRFPVPARERRSLAEADLDREAALEDGNAIDAPT